MCKKNHLITILLLTVSLTGCDSSVFNELFRNPYIVEIGHLDSMRPDKWYEFNTKKTKALNLWQEITITFNGSEPSKLNFENDNSTKLKSSSYPDSYIKFDVVAFDMSGKKYSFRQVGLSNGIIFSCECERGKSTSLQGKDFIKFKVKANLDYKNVNITWMSRTGK